MNTVESLGCGAEVVFVIKYICDKLANEVTTMKYKITFELLLVIVIFGLGYPIGEHNGNGDKVLAFITRFQMIISMLIAAIGWISTYYFNNKVQDRRLKNDILNAARKEITQGIREYQIWLSEVNGKLGILFYGCPHWGKLMDECRVLFFFEKQNLWNQNLEDYQILFPETDKVRVQLQDRNIEIGQLLLDFHMNASCVVGGEDSELINKITQEAQKTICNYINDQISLMEDLRRYLQNRCLGEITGNKIPQREPRDLSAPKIIINKKDGLLEIKNNVVGITEVGKMLQKVKKDHNYEY